jgi:hypothetical protein
MVRSRWSSTAARLCSGARERCLPAVGIVTPALPAPRRCSHHHLSTTLACAHPQLDFPEYGGKYVVSARCLNKNVVMESYGADVDPVDWNREPLGDCLGYVVQVSRRTAVSRRQLLNCPLHLA